MYLFDNVSVDFSRTIYVFCSECRGEMRVTCPQETPNDWEMYVKPCQNGCKEAKDER